MAGFHADADRSPQIDRCATGPVIAALWQANFAPLEPFVGPVLPAVSYERALALSSSFVTGRDALFDERIAGGFICDGHGDLLTDDIFVLDDGPRIIDCLEFDDRLRFADVVADLAFLAIDLERVGAPELATRLVDVYERESNEPVPRALLALWIAYRAQVRAMVACLRWEQDHDDAAADQARALMDLCVAHLERAAPRLVLVGGLPGTGKSTVAGALGERLGWPVLRSDSVRKELAGLAPNARASSTFERGIWTPERTQHTLDRQHLSLLAATGHGCRRQHRTTCES